MSFCIVFLGLCIPLMRRDVFIKLYNVLDLLFKKENTSAIKNYILPNQTNIVDQIFDIKVKKNDL